MAEEEEEAYWEQDFENIFSTAVNRNSNANTIKTIQVRKTFMSAIQAVVILMNGSETTYSFPVQDNKYNAFILFYGNKVVAPSLLGYDPLNQTAIDDILDKLLDEAFSDDSPVNLDRLMKLARKVNWAVSAAACKAAAYCKNIPLYKYIAELAHGQNPEFHSDLNTPAPAFNITNGVLHPANKLACQHLVVVPCRAKSFRESFKIIEKIYDRYFKVHTGDEFGQKAIDMGGNEHEVLYKPCIQDIKNCRESLKRTIADLGYAERVDVGLYIGASKLYGHDKTYCLHDRTYCLNFNAEKNDESPLPEISRNPLRDVYESLLRELGITSSRDLFDLDVKEYLEVDQIGSVTKCIEIVFQWREEDRDVVMLSHYSCQISDDFVADFCVALDLDTYKIGIPCIVSDCKIRNRFREIEVSLVDVRIRLFDTCWGRIYDFMRTTPFEDGENCTGIRADIFSGRMTKEQYKEIQRRILREGE